MKKISLFALALCTSAAVFAQDTQPQLRTPMSTQTRFGLRGGVNLADLTFKNLPSGTPVTEAQSKTSFQGGVFVNIPISSMFRFQPEVEFSSQGGKLQGPSGTGSAGEQDLHYLQLPLNFQLMSKNGLFLQTGPRIGYLLNAKAKSTMPGVDAEETNTDDFDKLDFSWTGGVGYLSRIGLGLDFRYNIGIANIIADDAVDPSYKGSTVKNSVYQFSLIYQFGAHK